MEFGFSDLWCFLVDEALAERNEKMVMELVRKEGGLVQVIKVAGKKSCLKSCKDNVQRSDFLICSELGYRMNDLIKCCQRI